MSARFAYVLAGLLTAVALPSVAQAQEVRDHRTGPAPATTVTPSNNGGRGGYRRRPGPRFMLPIKFDIGPSMVNFDGGLAGGLNLALGVHWASLAPEPTNFDIGIGVFGQIYTAPQTMSRDAETVFLGGAYLELGHTLSQGTWWRTWATGRGEYLGSQAFDQDKVGFGATGRLSVEAFLSGVGIEPRGLFLGTYAIGLYVEAGARDTVAEIGKIHGGAGITFRTPLVFSP
jgi:hypothetical protein